MAATNPRLRAVWDLSVAEVREYSGRHEYDGQIQDLSPGGVQASLHQLAKAAQGGRLDDEHDEAHLEVSEHAAQVRFGDLELHRSNPYFHIGNMDLACYEREYAPEAERSRAREAHLAAWPDAIEAAIASLDAVAAPVGQALVGAAAGLAAGIPPEAHPGVAATAKAAHARLVSHLEQAAAHGSQNAALGDAALSALMGSAEGIELDLGKLAERADAERDRLTERLAESCAQIDSGRPALGVARGLVRDHPDAEGVIEAAKVWTGRAIDFTRNAGLMPYNDGECVAMLAPESRRWAMAMMSTAAPGEPDGPSRYYITPPDPSWPLNEAEEWLEVFSDTTLPGITVHEVAPGHFSHGRAIRRAPTEVRRTLHSEAFVEGWAHYAEELCVEESFCDGDPKFAIGVWLEALVRVTRLACAIGVHTAGMSVEEGARRFEADTHLSGQAALSEANRATFDPSYGRYTWGKLEIMALRERARAAWGSGFSLLRFHSALLELGSPPLGLLETAINRG
ncbi:MAG: DUF885 domain-containing protein [Nocardiopsaceae bacterium]|jgi:hypothetical protein|nr:DUF885 domain-containing protein [Nocardiopsaceae bacterium]